MRKSLIIVFFVLNLTILLFIAYLLLSGKYRINSFQIYSEAGSPSLYPDIAWEDITSGKLLKFLENEDKKGKLLPISSLAEPISAPGRTNPELFNTTGLEFVDLSTNDFVANKYKNADKRPFRFVAFFKTNLGGTAYFVLVQKWLNPDGSTVFLPLIISEALAVNEDSTSAYYNDLIADDTVYFLSPILQIISLDRCKMALPDRKSYCDWYFENPKTSSDFSEIMNEWTKSGNIPAQAGMAPMAITASRLFKN